MQREHIKVILERSKKHWNIDTKLRNLECAYTPMGPQEERPVFTTSLIEEDPIVILVDAKGKETNPQ